jgi:iron(III) transport system substrate-binding protein
MVVTRRALLSLIAVASTGSLVGACQQSPPSASSAPPKPTAPAATPAAVAKTETPVVVAKSAAPARWGMTTQQASAWQKVEELANKEGAVTYYSVGSIPQNRLDTFQKLWKEDHPEIKVDPLYLGSSSVVAGRIITEQESSTYVADTGDFGVRQIRQLKAEFFEPFPPPAALDASVKWLTNPIPDLQPRGITSASFAQFFPLWINSGLVKPDEAPRNVMDIASNPKWKGQIIWRTPWVSGGGNHVYHFAVRQYGREWVTKMQAQSPIMADDQDAALLQVARGEYAIGLGLTGRQAGQLIKDGLPLSVVWPDDFVVTTAQTVPLLAHAPHPNATRVFINWLLSERGQLMWRDLGQFPLRSDIQPAEEWMRGVGNAKQVLENSMSEAEQGASYKQATADFKN